MKRISAIARETLPVPGERESHKRGYLARELVQCTLPHSKPKTNEYERRDGNLTVTITANSKIGLPYGTIPRLLMLWVTSEAMRTRDRKLTLGSAEKGGNSLNHFLREVGLNPATGNGKRGDAKRLRDQMVRLFRSRISFDYDETAKPHNADAWLDMAIAPKGYLWWDFNAPDERILFDSWIELDENFYQAITSNAVPVNLTMAGNLKRSPLALDLFVWATYRLYRMREGQDVTVSLTDLHRQFGAEYARQRDFKAKLTHALESLVEVWETELKRPAPLTITARGLRLTGIPHRHLPVQPEANHRVLNHRDSSNPFDISTSDLLKLSEMAPGWDIRALRREWETWCKTNGTTPKNPIAHFTSFVKKHKTLNG